MNKKIWTEEENKYILDNYNTMPRNQISKNIGCSTGALNKHAEELGLRVEKRTLRRWTPEEISLLESMAPKYLNKTIAKKLNRSLQEVNKKARELGIELIFKRPVWKPWKIKFVKENINKMSLTEIQNRLDVNYYQIMDLVEELNIKYESHKWTPEEVQILTDLAPKIYINQIAQLLNRTEAAVKTKACRLKLNYITLKKNYTPEELNYIKDNWGIISITDMARNLKVSRIMIQTQADAMNLPKLGNNPYRKWTPSLLKELEELSKTMTIAELAKYFKTTETAIGTIASRNNIILISSKVVWTEEENIKLKELSKTMTLLEIAKVMNRSTSAVRLQAKRLNIEPVQNQKHQNSIWTEENTKELIKLAEEGKTALEIAIIMNKNDLTICSKAKKLNIKLAKEKIKPWTPLEIDKLREYALTKNINELVRIFNRTTNSIKSVAKQHNINLIAERKNWTKEEYEQLEKLVKAKKTPKEIAELLGRTEDAIIIKINRRGLQIKTNDKRFWTEEEEEELADLWGVKSLEFISSKLDRTISSINNKAYLLGLGPHIASNYDGLTIKEISELLNISTNTISINWVSLGLKCKVKKVTKVKSYRYVEIKDLYDFLEANQNLWDSRNLEKNILGEEPDWLKEKRKRDYELNPHTKRIKITQQQLILAKKFFLELLEEILKEKEKVLVKK